MDVFIAEKYNNEYKELEHNNIVHQGKSMQKWDKNMSLRRKGNDIKFLALKRRNYLYIFKMDSDRYQIAQILDSIKY